MIVVTVARKPLGEPTVATNVLATGCGPINIDASRIGAGTTKQATAGRRTIRWGISEGGCSYEKGTGAVFSTEGRWPANLILEHLEGCQMVGTHRVSKGGGNGIATLTRQTSSNLKFSGTLGLRGTHYGEDGTETVPTWDCQPGCPVAALDEQSGERVGMSGGGATAENPNRKTGDEVIPSFNRKPSAPFIRGDKGGASRFFKQVGGKQ